MEIKKEECKHITIEKEGLWDGVTKTGEPISGPIIHCVICGKTLNMTWEVFNSIPRMSAINNVKHFKDTGN